MRGSDDPVKTTKLIVLSVGVAFAAMPVHVQAFQDLNFESGNFSNPTGVPPEVPITTALPGWSASIGGVPVTEVWANSISFGTAAIDVFGPGWTSIDPGIIDGNYTVFLQAFNAGQGNVSLWENGTIPANVESLQFKAWSVYPTANFSVSFEGYTLSPVVLSSGLTASGQDYNLYGVNMASYAGQSGQLEFTALANQGINPGNIELDDITFSTAVVSPEPSIVALTAIGGLLFGARKWFARR